MLDNDASNATVTGYVLLYNHDTSEYACNVECARLC